MFSVEPLDRAIVDSWPVLGAGLSTRAARALAAGGIATIGELRAMRTDTLRKLPGMGASTLANMGIFFERCGRLTTDEALNVTLDDVFGYFLDARDTQTLKRRYGLKKPTLVPLPKGDTLQGIARDLGVTRERVRQMEERALARLSSHCGRAFLSGLHRLYADGIAERDGAVEPDEVAGFVDSTVTDSYPPAAVLRLLCACMAGIVFHNGFFATAPEAALTAVAATALKYLRQHSEARSAGDVHEAIRAAVDLPAATRHHVITMTLLHAPEINGTSDGRYFLPETAAGDLAVEVMVDHPDDFHYRELQTRFNALMQRGSPIQSLPSCVAAVFGAADGRATSLSASLYAPTPIAQLFTRPQPRTGKNRRAVA